MPVGLGGGEDDAALGVVDRLQQGELVVLTLLLVAGAVPRKLNGEGARRWMLGRDPADQLTVDGARERPQQVQAIERVGIDVDDDDVLRRGLFAADREPSVDRVALERAERT